jgi:dihydropteroate synthase
MKILHCGEFKFALDRPRIMGIVNVTPDSFSDGGAFFSRDAAIPHALELIADGADIVDVGGESTRPGADPVDVDEELRRVIPIIEALRGQPVAVSVDTMKPEVMRAAIAAGASMVNDVNALRAPGALEVCAASGAGVCLMHMLGMPRTMQSDARYGDVVAEVKHYLVERALAAERAGINRDRIAIDPGFGFGKNREHNLRLLRSLNEFAATGYAVLVGLSRKSVLGKITGQEVVARVHASVAAALIAVQKGARIIRVHDVRATKDALAILEAVERETG